MIELKENVQDVLNNTNQALVKFSAPWCTACKAMQNDILEVEKQFPDIDFYEVDLDKHFEIGGMYQVRSIPTLVYMRLGEAQGRIGKCDQRELSMFLAGNQQYD